MSGYIFKREKKEESLNSICYLIPEIQRSKNNIAVKNIYDSENKYYILYGQYCTLGTISIAVNEQTGERYLVDGQHRMSAYKELNIDYPERRMNILVENWFYSSLDHGDEISMVEIISKIVNTCNPHPLCEMEIDEYKIIEHVEKYMKKEFSSYIKESVKCRIPSINMETFKN